MSKVEKHLEKSNFPEVKDYLDFLNSEEEVPLKVNLKVIKENKNLNNTDFLIFYGKLFLIFSCAGFVTFTFCPQFGLNPFSVSTHITHQFMNYGTWACGLFCGLTFMGTGSLIKYLFLGKRELLLIPSFKTKQILTLSSLIYGLYMTLGSQVSSESSIPFSLFETNELFGQFLIFGVFWLMAAVFSEKLTQSFLRLLNATA